MFCIIDPGKYTGEDPPNYHRYGVVHTDIHKGPKILNILLESLVVVDVIDEDQASSSCDGDVSAYIRIIRAICIEEGGEKRGERRGCGPPNECGPESLGGSRCVEYSGRRLVRRG